MLIQRQWRQPGRRWLVPSLAVAGLVAATVFLFGTHAFASATCTVSWANAVSGNWTDPTMWSPAAVPTSTDNACITVGGTYNVTVKGAQTVGSIQIGGTSGSQTLEISGADISGTSTPAALTVGGDVTNSANGAILLDDAGTSTATATLKLGSGTLSNSGTITTVTAFPLSGSSSFIDASLNNGSAGTVTIKAPTSFDLRGATETNSGTWNVGAGFMALPTGETFNQEAGSLGGLVGRNFYQVGGAFNFDGGTTNSDINAPLYFDNVAFHDGSNGLIGVMFDDANSFSGSVAMGQSLEIQGGANNGSLTAAGSFSNAGNITLDDAANATTLATLTLTSGTISNSGTISTATVATLSNTSTSFIDASVNNAATGTVMIKAPTSFDLPGATETNWGNWTVNGCCMRLPTSETFNQEGGTLGGLLGRNYFQVGGAFNFDGGTTNSDINAPLYFDGVAFHDGSNGLIAAVFNDANTFSGSVVMGQSLEIQAASSNASLTAAGSFSNAGTIVLDDFNGAPTLATLTLTSGTLSNSGTLSTATAPTNGNANTAFIDASVNNTALGTVLVKAPTGFDLPGAVETNWGNWTVNGCCVRLPTSETFNQEGGTLGGLVGRNYYQFGGAFNFDGGTTNSTPNEPLFFDGVAFHDGSNGSIGALFNDANTFSGSVAVFQSLEIQGGSANATLTAAGSFSNAGTIRLDDANGSTTVPTLTLTGGTLTNSGTITAIPSSFSGPAPSVVINGIVDNIGGVILHQLGQQFLTARANGPYSQEANGSLDVGIGGTTAGTGYDQLVISGAATLNGTLNLHTNPGFTPALGQSFKIMTFASATGTFSSVTGLNPAPGLTYSVNYNPTDVTLSLGQPPSITSAASTTFTAGQAGSFTVTATGNPMPALGESGSLPAGVTFVDNGNGTATLGGTPAPTAGGTYPLTISASGAGTATQNFILTVKQTPSFNSAATTSFPAGAAGSYLVTTSGYPTPSLSEAGALPAGVTFVANGDGTATLAGTAGATAGGAYPITLTATNPTGSATQAFTLVVDQAPAFVPSLAMPDFTQGTAGSYTIGATGYPKPTLTESGALPAGLTFTDNGDGTATIAGTPPATVQGPFPLTIGASNVAGAARPMSLTIRVLGPVSQATSTVTATPATVLNDGIASSRVEVSLKDSLGQFIPFKNVQLTPSAGTHSLITPSATSGTGRTGTAAFTVTDTSSEQVTYSATDTSDSVSLAQTATVSFLGPVSSSVSTVVASPTSVVNDGTSISTITVTLTDAWRTPLSGKIVSLTPGAGTHSTVTPASATTNAAGQAVFQATDTTAEVVAYSATDTTDATQIAQTATVTFHTIPTTTSATLSRSPTAVSQAVTVTATTTGSAPGGSPSGSVSFTTDSPGSFSASSCTLTAAGGNSGSCSVTYTPSAPGTLTHTIIATYGGTQTFASSSGSARLQIDTAPTVSAGTSYSGAEGAVISINAATASDPDGDPNLVYSWTVTPAGTNDTGSACTIGSPTALAPSVSCNDDGIYTLTLTATDSFGLSSSANATLNVTNVAPSVGPITGLPSAPLAVNNAVNAAASFTDAGTLDTHTASWNWGDGTSSAGTVSETNGSGSVAGSHTYGVDGVYTVTVTVTDADLLSASSSYQYVVIYDPTAGFVTGGGWITSPVGAFAGNPQAGGKATFGFVSKYLKGANVPTGNTEFHFQAGALNFNSTAYQWLVVSGACKAQFKGSGTINGSGSYTFLLTSIDGERCANPGPDTFRIQITDSTTGATTYDNGSDQAIGGGDIQVHSS